jgi:hypothetical protein
VWSNVACGAALSGAPLRAAPLLLVALAGSLFYIGGMLLNDAFDAEIDRRERPERPIPSGRATLSEVYGVGFGMLAAGLALLGIGAALRVSPAGAAWPLAGLGTALAVVAYNRWHKGYAWSPIVMGLCRAGLYVLGALAVTATPSAQLVPAAIALLLYIVGLTHIARFETASVVGKLWPVVFLFTPLVYAFAHPALRNSAETAVPLIACMMFSAASTVRALGFAKRGGRSIGTARGLPDCGNFAGRRRVRRLCRCESGRTRVLLGHGPDACRTTSDSRHVTHRSGEPRLPHAVDEGRAPTPSGRRITGTRGAAPIPSRPSL